MQLRAVPGPVSVLGLTVTIAGDWGGPVARSAAAASTTRRRFYEASARTREEGTLPLAVAGNPRHLRWRVLHCRFALRRPRPPEAA